MIIGRYAFLISVALSIVSHTVIAAEDDWKAARKAHSLQSALPSLSLSKPR